MQVQLPFGAWYKLFCESCRNSISIKSPFLSSFATPDTWTLLLLNHLLCAALMETARALVPSAVAKSRVLVPCVRLNWRSTIAMTKLKRSSDLDDMVNIQSHIQLHLGICPQRVRTMLLVTHRTTSITLANIVADVLRHIFPSPSTVQRGATHDVVTNATISWFLS